LQYFSLRGGGDKGAYQAGVIKGLIDNLPSNKTDYDLVTGISVGSINAAAFSVFEIGKEKEAADFL
jgi:NTE family protein